MSKMISAGMFCALAWLAACVSEQAGDDGASKRSASPDQVARAVDGDATPAEESAEASKEASTEASVLVNRWQIVWIAGCQENFGQPCTSTFPAPQCSASVTLGKPCRALAPECYRTIDDRMFEVYACQPSEQ